MARFCLPQKGKSFHYSLTILEWCPVNENSNAELVETANFGLPECNAAIRHSFLKRLRLANSIWYDECGVADGSISMKVHALEADLFELSVRMRTWESWID